MNLLVTNFRDVGKSINSLAGKNLLREGVLFRGGKIEDIKSRDDICSPNSIVNLRKGLDPVIPNCANIYAPAPDSVEVYDLSQGRNKKWVIETLTELFDTPTNFPTYIHCALGKDRTGVMVAAILATIGIPPKLIKQEYLLSRGLLQPILIDKTIEALLDRRLYRKVNVSFAKELLSVS